MVLTSKPEGYSFTNFLFYKTISNISKPSSPLLSPNLITPLHQIISIVHAYLPPSNAIPMHHRTPQCLKYIFNEPNSRTRGHHLACATISEKTSSGIFFTILSVTSIMVSATNGGKDLRIFVGLKYHIISRVRRVREKGEHYLGELKIEFLKITSCATIHKMFKCAPYANKKSHNLSTCGSGGVQAHNVNTDGKA
jgi:hypothetical protein